MADNIPAYCFTIPSVSDSTILDCRIYHPVSFQDPTTYQPNKKAALIAHPYAPLGGCMDDPVVMTVVEQLLELGFIVGTFNFRGAANSQGNTSWAGRGERDDYVSVAGHLLFYLNQTRKHNDVGNDHVLSDDADLTPSEPITLILGGYSYGSLIVTHLPPTAEILATFRQTHNSHSISEILLRAKELALQTNLSFSDQTEARGRLPDQPPRRRHLRQSSSQHSIVYGGSDSPSPADRHSTDHMSARLKHAMHRSHNHSRPSMPNSPLGSSEGSTSQGTETVLESLPRVLTHYLLISPLLPPISNLLSLSTSNLLFWRHADNKGDGLTRHPTLVIYGTKDMFTSSYKLDAWCKKMDGLSLQAAGVKGKSPFRCKKIEGAGHFWREHGVEAQLTNSLRGWVHEVVVPEQW
ncbi:hypothetical protein E4T47_02062 [Aureobasidium subglaciale]|nr:hypothetical protein E4T47_02062 [Aureobasidium subglaciale]